MLVRPLQKPEHRVGALHLLVAVLELAPQHRWRLRERAGDPQQGGHDRARAGAVADVLHVVVFRPGDEEVTNRVASKDHAGERLHTADGRAEESTELHAGPPATECTIAAACNASNPRAGCPRSDLSLACFGRAKRTSPFGSTRAVAFSA